jgi:hypothetical protein
MEKPVIIIGRRIREMMLHVKRTRKVKAIVCLGLDNKNS